MNASDRDPFALARAEGDVELHAAELEMRRLLDEGRDLDESDAALSERWDKIGRCVEIINGTAPTSLAGCGLLDALNDRGISEEQIVGVTQGWKLTGAIKRKLADGTMVHAGQGLMNWCVGNARVEPKVLHHQQPALAVATLRERVSVIVAEFDRPLPAGDAGLIEAERRRRQILDREKALYRDFKITHPIEDEIIGPTTTRLENELWDFIGETAPETLAGVIVKLRDLAPHSPDGVAILSVVSQIHV